MTAKAYPIVKIEGNRFSKIGEVTLTPDQFARSIPIMYLKKDPDSPKGVITDRNVNFRTLWYVDADELGISEDSIIHTSGRMVQ